MHPDCKKKIPRVLFLILLFFISFYYFYYGTDFFNIKNYHYDEGIVAYGATRIMDGEIPYRDFWTLYSPGVFYALAGVFKIFGISLNVFRIFSITVLSSTVCCIYWIIKRTCSGIFGIFAFLLSIFWLKSYLVYNRPGQLAILSYIVCSISLFNFLNTESIGWLVTTGILSGLVCIFRQDFGVYVFCSLVSTIFLKYFTDTKKEKLGGQKIFKDGLYFTYGLLAVILPVFTFFIFSSPANEFVYDLLIFPVSIYPRVRVLPMPKISVENLIFYIPVIVFLLSGLKILSSFHKAASRDNIFWLSLFFLISGLGFMFYTSIRIDFSHLLPTMIPAIILFILFLYDFIKKNLSRNYYIFETSVCVFTFLILFCLLKPSFKAYGKTQDFLFLREPEYRKKKIDIARASGFYNNSEAAQSAFLAIKYIQKKVDKSEKIFVGNLRHDKVVFSDVLFYFLSNRKSATKYYELHPGLTNTKKIQEAIINDLNKKDVRYVVLWSGSEDAEEPNESSKSSGITELDDFIHKNYKFETKFGYYTIMSR